MQHLEATKERHLCDHQKMKKSNKDLKLKDLKLMHGGSRN